MGYTLVGSIPSPFVRRIRMAMEHIPFEFKVINIYEEAGHAEIHRLNPTNQIPCLLDGTQPIWDSRIILQHLGRKHGWPALTLDQENRMTAIERMIDAGVGLFMLKKSDVAPDSFYGKRLNERIVSVMEWLKRWMTSAEAREWNQVTLTLYAGLDWMKFREIHPLAQSAEAQAFLAHHADRSIVKLTDPRQG